MQKLVETQFYCYPKNQDICILYTDVSQLKTKLFKALSLQVSAKEGFLLRFRKTKLGHNLAKQLKPDKIKFETPNNTNLKIAYKNKDKVVFFNFDEQANCFEVIRKETTKTFINAPFLGYSIIEAYSKKEYFKKRDFLIEALKQRWKEVNLDTSLHGDFTHFNVLISDKKNIHFIDKKQVVNSILFDHFYFYSYYIQCLEKCQTISVTDVSAIKKDLQNCIKEICVLDDVELFLNQINTEDAIGLVVSERENWKKEFVNFMR